MAKDQVKNTSEIFEAIRQAEEALLGAILIESSYSANPVYEIKFIVSASDFLDHNKYDNRHSRIYQAMLNCDRPQQINVAIEMARQGTLKPRDCAHLSHCIAMCPCSLDYLSYAKVVKEYSLIRNGKKMPVGFRGIDI